MPERMWNTAVLMVDLQKMYLQQELRDHYGWPAIWELDRVVRSCSELLAAARERHMPVIYTRQINRDDEADTMPSDQRLHAMARARHLETLDMTSGSEATQIVDELAPRPGDIVIEKLRWDAFFGTPLDNILRNLRVERLLVAGLQTNVCIESTVRTGLMMNYEVGVAEDAVSTDGEALHFASLDSMRVLYAEVLPWRELIDNTKTWDHGVTTPGYGRGAN